MAFFLSFFLFFSFFKNIIRKRVARIGTQFPGFFPPISELENQTESQHVILLGRLIHFSIDVFLHLHSFPFIHCSTFERKESYYPDPLFSLLPEVENVPWKLSRPSSPQNAGTQLDKSLSPYCIQSTDCCADSLAFHWFWRDDFLSCLPSFFSVFCMKWHLFSILISKRAFSCTIISTFFFLHLSSSLIWQFWCGYV